MANLESALKEAMTIDGAIGVALVDYDSGMALGTLGDSAELDLNVAAAGNTDLVRAKMRTMQMLNLHDNEIEDMLITLTTQYHLIRPLTMPNGRGLFLYLALNRARANMAMARHQLRRLETTLEL
ncbi:MULTISPECIES: hypothetical protein [unclassified Kitasatospora]|uniref:hypothetical protein n=1 Tax=unclassified Kitasatospora TaxID=2633591 RepID=UPI00070BB507|nr:MULTISPECIES: hypothetical protein [unclassified Kitasatospora]KQV22900.1 hypothetical protein ASC99_17310 [Kitasatospora sp. Root107]KRB61760.1 hypothetical protein ASE03_09095 [Kitasatospora sp. Root187]